MIPAVWSHLPGSYLWQVAVHATVMGFIFYAWTRHVRLPSGRTKRWLLGLVLVLPLVTAAMPGRTGVAFAEGTAWLNSARLLAIPVIAGARVEHLILAGAILMVVITIWQELSLSVMRPRAAPEPAPDAVMSLVRNRASWTNCEVAISPVPSILVATSGWPSRPRLIISRGALDSLSEDELALAVAHEHAHWQDGRWRRLHGLFLIRLLQCYHPVALWVFREYCLEVEVDCDQAAAGPEGRPLARLLLRVYEQTDRRDSAGRAALRKRIDVLMAGGPQDAALPASTVAAAAVLMGVLLPWIV